MGAERKLPQPAVHEPNQNGSPSNMSTNVQTQANASSSIFGDSSQVSEPPVVQGPSEVRASEPFDVWVELGQPQTLFIALYDMDNHLIDTCHHGEIWDGDEIRLTLAMPNQNYLAQPQGPQHTLVPRNPGNHTLRFCFMKLEVESDGRMNYNYLRGISDWCDLSILVHVSRTAEMMTNITN
eukprot:c296_g1_i2.p1 GENE.c296_g1_i2~~c296_g1_i2.p1  ORF type:complete len:181 (+),score=19.10 c296_g1_i2:1-543(+)